MVEDRKILRLVEVFDDVFDEFEDVIASHPAQVSRPMDACVSLDSLLASATTHCLPLQQRIDARQCMQCDHFIGCNRNADGTVSVRCWTHKRRERLARGTQALAVPLKFS